MKNPVIPTERHKEKKMAKMFSMCGLDCAVCPAFIAHKTDDNALREKTAAEWSQQFHVELKAADINCSGCVKTKGVHFSHCGECEMRRCGLSRQVKSCALCDDYACQTLSQFLAHVPAAQANLEQVRRTRHD